MVAGCVTHELTVSVSIERVFKAIALDEHNLLPKLLPDLVVSGEIVEKDSGNGAIRKYIFAPAVKASFSKDRFQVDHENHLVKYTVIEGGLIGKLLKSQVFEVKYEASGNGGCMVKTKIDYDTLNDKPLSEEEIAEMKAGVVQALKAIEGYLIANPRAYA